MMREAGLRRRSARVFHGDFATDNFAKVAARFARYERLSVWKTTAE